jgi:molybdopterin/thiamine biosynthesis adenylyltransferase
MRAAAETTFAVIGAGGLGGPVAYALAAAGARALTLCDPDVVDLGNLQRQVQFTGEDIGRPKVEALADELVRRGSARAGLRPLRLRFAADTADRVLDGVDVVIEGTDDPVCKFAVNDAAVARGLRFAIGGVERHGGQVFAGRPGAACYRCLFEGPPADSDPAPTCADAGVLGAAVAVIGGLLARTALDLAAGGGDGAAGELLVVDDTADRSPPRRVRYNPRRGCPACRT